MKRNVDYLIVGQGLAGTFLAYKFLKTKRSFMLIDKGLDSSSSYVAAGLINPLVLKRLTLSWRAKEFLAYNESFYSELEEFLGKNYRFKVPIEKLISSSEEELFWGKRFEKEELSDLMEKELGAIDSKIKAPVPFKVGKVKHTSWVHISDLLSDFRSYLKNENLLIEDTFKHKEIEDNTRYGAITFSNIVFCEGAKLSENPFFNYLPYSLNKGQLLTIRSKELPQQNILKKKVFILPYKEDLFKVGATFSWKWENENPEEEKTEQLKTFLEEMTSLPYEIVNVEAGIRPSVKDRRPLIGKHPKISNYYLFNGMGSRGCFMAPLLIDEFFEHLEKGKEVHPETDINRFAYS
jgi:glycine/D-amino acid oxidase-like deaminating enzyme